MEIVGSIYTRLTVIKDLGTEIYKPDGEYRRKVLAKCICGVIKEYWLKFLKRGSNKSCGCLSRENIVKLKLKHGLHGTPLYGTWKNMRNRCNSKTNPYYRLYGGRGIKIQKEWDDFKVFYEWCINNGWRKNLKLDRRDNDTGYNENNCRFVTQKVNVRNGRATNQITYKGKTQSIIEWSEEAGLPYKPFLTRIIVFKWEMKKAMETPIGPSSKKQGYKQALKKHKRQNQIK